MIVFVFTLTSFFSALVLFSAQPFMAKAILPVYGGSPAVWNTAMVFYQGCLLLGYAYVHVGIRHMGWRNTSLINLALASLALLLLLPPLLPHDVLPTAEHPALSVMHLLTVTIGLPFLLVSCNAPLLQALFARSSHPDRENPYFLYAASNLGSMAALLSYPFLIEPLLSVTEQARLWSTGFLVLTLLLAASMGCLLAAPESRDDRHAKATTAAAKPANSLSWLLYSALPSALLLAVTNHITTDIAAIPLLWVVPLALYLLTFVIAFSTRGRELPVSTIATIASAIAAMTLASRVVVAPAMLQLTLNLLLLFFVSLTCHLMLVRRRPDAEQLTAFYLAMSLGGFLGGVSVSLLAPLIFSKVHEYYLLMTLGLLIFPAAASAPVGRPLRIALMSLGIALLAGLFPVLAGSVQEKLLRIAAMAAFLLAMLYFAGRPRMQALVIALMSLPFVLNLKQENEVYAGRSFYGTYIVKDAPDHYRTIAHGTTIHGAQFTDATRRMIPLSYYHPEYVMGDIMRGVLARAPAGAELAVVGLGSGAMTCNARSQDRMTYFEIDPLVMDIARDPKLFTYLRDCPPSVRIVTGDARLTLAREADGRYDFLLLDAFSSDAIPVHIMTREAMQLYEQKVKPDGLIVFHISNRHLDLKPVVKGLASAVSREAWVGQCDPRSRPRTDSSPIPAAVMVALSRPGKMPESITGNDCWKRLDDRQPVDWTDDYSNLWSVFR